MRLSELRLRISSTPLPSGSEFLLAFLRGTASGLSSVAGDSTTRKLGKESHGSFEQKSAIPCRVLAKRVFSDFSHIFFFRPLLRDNLRKNDSVFGIIRACNGMFDSRSRPYGRSIIRLNHSIRYHPRRGGTSATGPPRRISRTQP